MKSWLKGGLFGILILIILDLPFYINIPFLSQLLKNLFTIPILFSWPLRTMFFVSIFLFGGIIIGEILGLIMSSNERDSLTNQGNSIKNFFIKNVYKLKVDNLFKGGLVGFIIFLLIFLPYYILSLFEMQIFQIKFFVILGLILGGIYFIFIFVPLSVLDMSLHIIGVDNFLIIKNPSRGIFGTPEIQFIGYVVVILLYIIIGALIGKVKSK